MKRLINAKTLFALFIAVLCANFYLFDWSYLRPIKNTLPSKSDTEIAEFIKSIDQGQNYKVWHDVSFNNTYQPRIFNLSQFGIHESQVTGWNWLSESYMEFKGQKELTFKDYASSPYTFEFNKHAMQLFGVKYLVSTRDDLADSEITKIKSFDISGNYDLASGTAYLYTFNNPYPLVYTQKEKAIAGELLKVSDLNQNSSLKIDSYQPNQVIVNVTENDSDKGYLVLNELFFPGWKAQINSKEVPVEIINHGVRGVKIPPGSSQVRFYYSPPAWNLSVLISILSGLILILLFIWKSNLKKAKQIS